jgi:hydroxypyruvate reductase
MPTLRTHALAIFKAALKAAAPAEAVRRHLKIKDGVLIAGKQRYRLSGFRHVYVIGAGKASAAMAQAVERLLGSHIDGGLINVKYGHVAKLRRVRLNECGHPVPDEAGVLGAREIAEIASQAGADDLVICLISGGGSALLPSPAPPITLAEKQAVTKLLLASGANIHEINAVRKHISLLKGGQLARLAFPATVLTLLLSDVIGDNLDVIGSGPTVPDTSSFADARSILDRYGIWRRTPETVRRRIQRGVRGEIAETPKPGDSAFRRTQNLIVGGNRLAVDAAAAEARKFGYRTTVLSTFIEGEAREVAHVYAAIAKQSCADRKHGQAPHCVIAGGETTVTLRGAGLGGRNQELVLSAAIDIAGLPRTIVLSAGTDGTDGPTDAAGAIADGQALARARALRLDARQFLANNDSYRFFDALGGLIKTGPTNTNVMDITIVLCG